MAANAAYQAMRRVATELRLPRSYKTDLTEHDRKALAGKAAPREFGWLICASGTDIFVPTEAVEVAVDWLRACWGQRQSEDGNLFWWDGARLERVAVETCEHRLRRACRDYARERMAEYERLVARTFDALGRAKAAHGAHSQHAYDAERDWKAALGTLTRARETAAAEIAEGVA